MKYIASIALVVALVAPSASVAQQAKQKGSTKVYGYQAAPKRCSGPTPGCYERSIANGYSPAAAKQWCSRPKTC